MAKHIIAIDVMGGDHGPDVTVPAALDALQQHSKRADSHSDADLALILVGQEDVIRTKLRALNVNLAQRTDLSVRHAPQTVAMDEAPAQALRTKKQSSMRVAINLVKQGEAHACVSAGNTGALMATARFVLKTLVGIDRPAICTTIPALRGHTHVLDLGANVDSKADHLLQFAVMGSVLATAVDDLAQPKVALLNIGEEAIKGNEQVQNAARVLSESPLNYVGFVEGNGIYMADVDVVVCDGFVGNVALKASEGVAKLIHQFMKQEFKRTALTKLAGLAAAPVLKALGRRIDPRRYNGASLLGLQGIVIKSHGGADALAFANAIHIAQLEVAKAVPERISKLLSKQDIIRQAL